LIGSEQLLRDADEALFHKALNVGPVSVLGYSALISALHTRISVGQNFVT